MFKWIKMEIDEFLEMEKDKMEKAPGPKVIIKPEEKLAAKGQTMEDLIDQIRLFVQKRNFKQAGMLYLVLKEQYNELTKSQLEEKHFIHDELEDINKKLIEIMEQEIQNMNRQEAAIKELLQKAEAYLKKWQVEEANNLYKEIKILFNKLPAVLDEKKYRLENEILNFYSRLTVSLTAKRIEEFERIKGLLENASKEALKAVERKDIQYARKLYVNMNNLFNSLPEGFVYEKILLYRKILEIYKETELETEIGVLSQQLKESEKTLTSNISAGKTEKKEEHSQMPRPRGLPAPPQAQKPKK